MIRKQVISASATPIFPFELTAVPATPACCCCLQVRVAEKNSPYAVAVVFLDTRKPTEPLRVFPPPPPALDAMFTAGEALGAFQISGFVPLLG